MMKSILIILISFALVVSGASQTRNVVVGTNGAVVQPTNFWSADASNARTGLGIGSSATNPASAFQSSSSVLSNLASSNAVNLTNVRATNIVGSIALASNVSGIVSIANGGTGGSTAGEARTNLNAQQASIVLSNLANSNGVNLTNLNISNLGTILITGGGTGATNAETARTNLGLGSTNSVSFGALTVANETYVGYAEIGWDTVKIQFEERFFEAGSGFGWTFNQAPIFADVSGTRANLGLSLAALTNTNITNFRTSIGLGSTNAVTFGTVGATSIKYEGSSSTAIDLADGILRNQSQNVLEFGDSNAIYVSLPIAFITNSLAATTRTNLGLGATWLTNTNVTNFRSAIGLGWSALTNSNAGTSLVSVNTNGEVVSPTNFWQVAPIQTLVQDLTVVVTSQTNNATNARNLYVYSLATNVTGISNTIILPTNAATFAGDEATVIHQGTTNTTTVIRQAGSTNNLITLNRFDESVKFIRESGQWNFYHNISFVEPIQFSGTNAVASAGGSRTNLGIGWSVFTNTDTTNFHTAIFNTNTTPTNAANLGNAVAWMEMHIITNGATNSFRIPLFK